MALARHAYRAILVLFFTFILASVTFAQAAEQTPTITVDEEVSVGDSVTVNEVVAPQPGFVVIQEELAGVPGPIIGQTVVPAGRSENVTVPLSEPVAPGTRLFATLFSDTEQPGVFEFPDADTPVFNNNEPVRASFMAAGDEDIGGQEQVQQPDQQDQQQAQAQGEATTAATLPSITINETVSANGNVMIQQVTIPERGFLVIQRELVGVPGPIIGQVSVPAGTTENVVVPLTESVEPGTQLFASLYSDAGLPGVFEFPGADSPLFDNNQSVTESFLVGDVRQEAVPATQQDAEADDGVTATEEEQDQQQAQQEQQTQPQQQAQQQQQDQQTTQAEPAVMPVTGVSGSANLPFTLLAGGLAFGLLVGGNGLVQRLRRKP